MSEFEPDAQKRVPVAGEANAVPAWAMTYAAAALRCGQTAAQIEAALVGKGLSPHEAAATVIHALESSVRHEWQSVRRSARLTRLNRSASLAVALAIAVMTAVSVPDALRTEAVFRKTAFLLFPLACIWFSQAFGRYEGPAGGGYRRSTPGLFVAAGGWLVLGVLLGTAAHALLRG